MNKNTYKKITISLFLIFIFTIPATMTMQEDKSINEIENKILQKLPRFNFENVSSGRFMKDFDIYVSDQFPGRNSFLYLKNRFNYLLGNREFREIYVSSSGRLLEKYQENKDFLKSNIYSIDKISMDLDIKNTLFLIPSSTAIYPDELPEFALNDSQKESIDYIDEISKINLYSPLDILYNNKDEYVYFRTDHHWTQLGAKLAYEDFYKTNINLRSSLISKGFYGTYYSKAMLNNIESDQIYSYENLKDYKNEFDGKKYDSIYGKEKLKNKNKYQYFLNGDPAEGIIYGEGEGEILIIKDSFAHCFIPFLAEQFEKIHVIDPRYSNKDIHAYLNEHKDISEIIFMFSLPTLNNYKLFDKK